MPKFVAEKQRNDLRSLGRPLARSFVPTEYGECGELRMFSLNGKAAKRTRKTEAKDSTNTKARQITPENHAFL